jgi:outer membrane protein OmpA-like peptidoglycan-associated protein
MHRPIINEASAPPAGKWALLAAALLVASGCGGIIEFRDNSAIQILGAAPPPPAPEPPPKPPARVEVRDNSIEIKEKIQFAYNDSTILEVSFSLLDEVGKVIKENPHVKAIEIGGHASSEGDDTHNLKLSEKRAASVKQYLIEKAGVAAGRLTSKG